MSDMTDVARAEVPAPAAADEPQGRLGGRTTWIMADQAVSSLSNAALTLVIARTVAPAEFGAFALAFSIYSFCVAVSQALAGQVVMIRYSAEPAAVRLRAATAAGGTALALGALASLVLVGVSIVVDLPLRGVLLALAVLFPTLLLQDTWRTVFVSRGTPREAFINDAVWVALQVVAIGALIVVGVDSAAAYTLAWGGAAAGAAAYGVLQVGARPRIGMARRFVVDHRDVSGPSVAQAISILGANQIAFVLVAAFGTIEVVGALRGALTLLGPLNIVGFALGTFAVPEIVRLDLDRRGLVFTALGISAVLVVVDLMWGGVLLLVPDGIGRQALGETWPTARAALPGMITFTAAIGATTGAMAVMRSLARMRYVFWNSAVLSPLVIACSVIGVRMAMERGAAWGLAVAALAVVGPTWWLLARAVRRGRLDHPGGRVVNV
jgi:O-antigen/teichoic acid export membrane protein